MKKALCVGINHFKRPGNDLAGCVPDAKEMQLILKVDEAIVCLDSQATKFNAMSMLKDLVAQAKSGQLSYLAFSWSGHGTHYPRPEEPDGLGEALVCYDLDEVDGEWNPAGLIKDTELRDLLNRVPLSCTVEVWLDTCYSGGMNRVFGAPGVKHDRFIHNPNNPGSNRRIANSTISQGLNSNIIMWTASSEAQEAADARIAGGAHGAFTYYWCEAFRKNSKVSRVETLLSTRKALAANRFDQFPRLKCWNGPAQKRVGV